MTCKKYDGKRGVSYYFTIDIAPKGAPRKQVQRRGFRSKKSCEAARHKELTERAEGTHIEPSRETVAAYLERWRQAVAPRWRPNTRAKVAEMCTHLSRELGDVPLARLDTLQIQAAYARLLAGKANEDAEASPPARNSLPSTPKYTQKPLAPSTLRTHHTQFKSALKAAVAYGLIRRNPAEGIALPTPTSKEIAAWSASEQSRFLASTRDDPWHPLWRLLVDSGCRIGEALALTWDDVDLTTRYVTIRRTLTRDEARRPVLGSDTKTIASRRSLQLHQETITVLERHRTAQKAQRLAVGEVWRDLGLVFAGDTGGIPNTKTLWLHLQRGCLEAGVPPLSAHGLRKTMTTLWLEAGVAPSVVAARLGHKNVQMTLNIYTKVSRAWGESGLEAVDLYLRKEQARKEPGVGEVG